MSVPYDLTELYSEDQKPKSLMGTMTSSLLIHSALAFALFVVTPPALDLVNNNIDIEVIEPQQIITPPVVDTTVKEIAPQEDLKAGFEKPKLTQNEAAKAVIPKSAAQASSTKDAELSDKIKAPMVKAQNTAAAPQMKTSVGGGEAALATTVASSAGTPQTLDDIAIPELDTEGVDVSKVGALADNEFDQDFSKVAANTNAAIVAEKNNLDADFKNTADEADASIAGLENQNQQFAKTMDESIAATRTKNAAALNKIKAGELAAAEAAARKEQERVAKENAMKAAKNQEGSTAAGAGFNGGSAKGMRNISQLKQMPGNPKPSYSMDERFRKEQGEIIVQAFVTQQGTLKDLKVVQSTGYGNLDQKTLAALKKWKFYPGQEGLVEIPQVWSLKGDAEEMPATLRR